MTAGRAAWCGASRQPALPSRSARASARRAIMASACSTVIRPRKAGTGRRHRPASGTTMLAPALRPNAMI
ncbi:hypothetical protein [Sphingomonas sp. S-NIH.Pt1_0416]|uniref:hypothetical protein n=1 Tax=Sphingomonas sp. S-NIH.Pt1_0416 TaxID=1920123 RepID=UPI0013DEC59B|nr:hypothetical protein [Sphingomonas sp. S-NIH.Pt1_0416]